MSRSGRPVAVFDSGVGGLTVLHECLVSLPSESFVYLGDTGHFPYGTKSAEELEERAGVITRYLIASDIKLLVVACNSATATAGPLIHEMADAAGVPVVTVIGPEAEIASAISSNGRVGVMATPATVGSGAYREALESNGRPLTVTEVAAPDLAPIIQDGFPFDEGFLETVRGYVEPMHQAGVDTLILGCTHYPLIAPMLQRMLGRDVRLVTAGHAMAAAVQRELAAKGLETDSTGEGDYRFLVTGDPESFAGLGTRFLQLPLEGRIEKVDV